MWGLAQRRPASLAAWSKALQASKALPGKGRATQAHNRGGSSRGGSPPHPAQHLPALSRENQAASPGKGQVTQGRMLPLPAL